MIPEIDAVMHELIKANEPGAAVSRAWGEVIHRQGYGSANIEWVFPSSRYGLSVGFAHQTVYRHGYYALARTRQADG